MYIVEEVEKNKKNAPVKNKDIIAILTTVRSVSAKNSNNESKGTNFTFNNIISKINYFINSNMFNKVELILITFWYTVFILLVTFVIMNNLLLPFIMASCVLSIIFLQIYIKVSEI